jgi:hypothetical protein
MNVQTITDFSHYRLCILPGRCRPGFPFVELHNRVFSFWRDFWAGVFAQNGSPSLPDPNVFYRQDFVAVIYRGEQIVGTLFCTENNLASDVTCGISYFARPRIAEFARDLRERNLNSVATYEMLTVSPQFRKNKTGISFGTVLLGIVVNAFRDYGADVMVGPVRLDIGVDKMVKEFGWELVSPEYELHGTPVAISALFKDRVRECQNPAHRALIQKLWRERTDHRATADSVSRAA